MLENELEIFEFYREEWAQSHSGKFVVIQGNKIIKRFYESYEDAFRAGILQFGADRNFLVKQVWKVEPVYFVA